MFVGGQFDKFIPIDLEFLKSQPHLNLRHDFVKSFTPAHFQKFRNLLKNTAKLYGDALV